MISGGRILMSAPFRLLGSGLSAEPLLSETGSPAADVAELLTILHLHIGFLVCRRGFDVENNR